MELQALAKAFAKPIIVYSAKAPDAVMGEEVAAADDPLRVSYGFLAPCVYTCDDLVRARGRFCARPHWLHILGC